ncbi:hypothetical protein BBO99_00003878 [Phytophthora kernoviae]|uniref:Kazal-like domain-containing protein n=1 Tax=Phytophthora kernoviae TaxID=325452 RepID=A0A421F564_9STRA|nr:hypothetical protein JM18_007923 [Phytophthora kernoviae]RLN25742.1 hypothetical protein BBI17_003925 [Phytophthora kernoviae]RLN81225.1 hypothetical protein BBO99_00003878 [Phytophthora kernoviae]
MGLAPYAARSAGIANLHFSFGLMLAAVAITAAHAGNPKTLRGTDSTDDCPEVCPDKYKPVTDDKGVEYPNKCYMKMSQCRDADSDSGSDDTLVDLTDIFGSGSDASGSDHVLLDLKDLVGSGSNQITLQELVDAIDGDDSGSDGSDDLDIDLGDLFGSDSDGSDDDILDDLKSLFGSGSGDDKLDLKDLIGSGSGQITLQELIHAIGGSDSDSDAGNNAEQQTFVKGANDKATKGKATKVIDYDSTSDSDDGSLYDDVLVKGTKGKATKVIDYDSTSDSDDGSLYDDVLVKGTKETAVKGTKEVDLMGTKETATKSSKSSKSTKSSKTPTEEASSVGSLFEDSSLGFIGSDEADEELLKNYLNTESDDGSSESDEDDDEKQQQVVSEKASKSTKTSA